MEFNYYQILGVPASASEEDIKTAFKTLAKKYHPDKHAGNLVYEEHFKKINMAYQTLSDAHKRKRYDMKLFFKVPKSTPPKTQYRSQTQPPFQRPMKKTSAPTKEDKRKNFRYAAITLSALALFITGAVYFYYYMNALTAQDRYQEGLKMEALQKEVFAMECYSAAISYDESLLEAYIRRAQLKIKILNDYEGAAYDYSNVLKQKEDAQIYFKRAKCYLQLKRYDELMADLDKAIAIQPKFDTLYYYKGEVNNYIYKKYEEAIKDYEKALSLNKNFTEALLGKGISWQSSMYFKESIDDFTELIQMKPEEGRYYYYRGYSKFMMKDTSSACNDWFQAEKLYFFEARKMMNEYCH